MRVSQVVGRGALGSFAVLAAIGSAGCASDDAGDVRGFFGLSEVCVPTSSEPDLVVSPGHVRVAAGEELTLRRLIVEPTASRQLTLQTGFALDGVVPGDVLAGVEDLDSLVTEFGRLIGPVDVPIVLAFTPDGPALLEISGVEYVDADGREKRTHESFVLRVEDDCSI